MVNSEERLKQSLSQLENPADRPDQESETIQNEWIDLMECEGLVAGMIVTRLNAGRIERRDLSGVASLLASKDEWPRFWPERFKVLSSAVDLLTQLQ
jgi:hypothetical protein